MQSEPLPAIPIEYSTNEVATPLRLVRVLGVLGLVIGSIGVVATPLMWLDPQSRMTAFSSGYRAIALLMLPLAVGLSVLLIIGCAQSLRRAPRGRTLLLVYAYGYFALMVIGIVVNASITLQYYGRRNAAFGNAYALGLIGAQVARSLGGMSYPLLLAVLLPRSEVRRIFETEWMSR